MRGTGQSVRAARTQLERGVTAGFWNMIKCLNSSFHLCVGGEAGGPTCVSVSALIVDAHRVLAH